MVMFYFMLLIIFFGFYKFKAPIFLILTGAKHLGNKSSLRKMAWDNQLKVNHFLLKDLAEEFVVIKKSRDEFTVISRNNYNASIERVIPLMIEERSGEKFFSPFVSAFMSISIVQKAILMIFFGALSELFIRPFIHLNRTFTKWRFHKIKEIVSNPHLYYSLLNKDINLQSHILPLEFLGVTPSLLRGLNETT